jgi:hypothetical protein
VTRRDRENLASIAKQVRGECSLVRGECIDLTVDLVRSLRTAGYPARRIAGVVHPDGYWDDNGKPHLFSRGDPPTGDDWMNHNWAEVEGVVVDVSADQFNEVMHPRRRFPPILVAPAKKLRTHEAVEVVT